MPSNQTVVLILHLKLTYLTFVSSESVAVVGRVVCQKGRYAMWSQRFLVWVCCSLSLKRMRNENIQFLFINEKNITITYPII